MRALFYILALLAAAACGIPLPVKKALLAKERADAHGRELTATICPTDDRAAVRNAIALLACCSSCRSTALKAEQAWKRAFGSQLNTNLDYLISHLLKGHTPNALRMKIMPFSKGREHPQEWVNTSRCPNRNMACLFSPVSALCSLNYTISSAKQRADAVALLNRAHPYHLASESARLLLTPNLWLSRRVAIIARALTGALSVPANDDAAGDADNPDSTADFIGIHVRRGDKLITPLPSEAITLLPTSAIANTVAQLAARHRLRRVVVLSDDEDVAPDLAALLPSLRVVTLQIPHMSLAHGQSHISKARFNQAGAGRGRTPSDSLLEPCGLPGYLHHPPLASCVAKVVEQGKPLKQAIALNVERLLNSNGVRTSANDLGALLMAALLNLARARILVGSSRSNVAVLVLTLVGAQVDACSRSLPHFIDYEQPRAFVSRSLPAFEPFTMRDLVSGRYFCHISWGGRKGLCYAGRQRNQTKE